MKLRRLIAVALLALLLPLAGGCANRTGAPADDRAVLDAEYDWGILATDGLIAAREGQLIDDGWWRVITRAADVYSRTLDAKKAKLDALEAARARGEPDIPLSPLRTARDAYEAAAAEHDVAKGELARHLRDAKRLQVGVRAATTRAAPAPAAAPPATPPSGGPVD